MRKWSIISLILIILAVPAYIFISGGLLKETFMAAISWVLVSIGYLAYRGGEKKAGAVVAAVGIILVILFLK